MDSADEIDKNRLSEVVSDILKCESFSIDKIEVLRSVCLLIEKLEYDLFGRTMIRCGSSLAEGSEICGSDMDFMTVVPGIIAVIDGTFYLSDGTMNIFTTVFDNCSPGFTKLQVYKLNQNSIFNTNIQSMIKKDGNRYFLSSGTFLKPLKSQVIEDWTIFGGNSSLKSHGPCLSFSKNNINVNGIPTHFDFDITYGIKCHSWPVAACEWKNRPRPKGWPSPETVEIVSAFPVHVMPIGNDKSNYSSIHWRFAFSKAERELIWNFNNIQFQCYVLLKCIFKVKLQPISPDELSGYQMKNLLFWISEEYGVEMFTKTNLLHCIEICLERFKQHIMKGFLSQYFIRNRNLLAGKLNTKTRKRIGAEINKNLKDIFYTIVQCLHIINTEQQSDNDFLNMYNGSKESFLYQVREAINHSLLQHHKTKKWLPMIIIGQLCVCMVSDPDINKNNVLAFIGNINSGKYCSNTILPCMLEKVTRFGFIQLGMMLCDTKYRINKTPEEIAIENWVTDIAFKVGFDLDELSGKLYWVTFSLLNNKLDAASKTLSLIMRKTKPFCYTDWNLNNNKMRVIQLLNSEIRDTDYVEVDYEFSVSHGVYFPIHAVHFVPEPIKYELFLSQESYFCEYDPVVYAFYLMFEIARKKDEHMTVKNQILRKLLTFIEKCVSSDHRPLAYNLLGYCYYVCGRIDEAVDTFCLSMQDKSDSKNVAVYHLCIILSKYVASKAAVI